MRILVLAALAAMSFVQMAQADVVIFDGVAGGAPAVGVVANGGLVEATTNGIQLAFTPSDITVTQNATDGNPNIALTSADNIGTLLSAAGLPALTLTDTVRATWTTSSVGELINSGVEFGFSPAGSLRGGGNNNNDIHTLFRIRPDGTIAANNEPGYAPGSVFAGSGDAFFDSVAGGSLGDINVTEDSLEDGFTFTQEISLTGVTTTISGVVVDDGIFSYTTNFGSLDPLTGDFTGNNGAALNFLSFVNGLNFYGSTHSAFGGAGGFTQQVTSVATIEIISVPEPSSALLITSLLGVCVSRRRRA